MIFAVGPWPAPKVVITEITDPEHVAKSQAQFARGRLNADWLAAHWPDLMPQVRGKFLAVAGQEAHIADTLDEACAWAKTAHPEDDGALVQYVSDFDGPCIYACHGPMATGE